ncbi:MAG: cytochrome P450 [Parvularculaceae bacterium]
MIATLDLDPFTPEALEDPYQYHDALRDAGPVVWLEKYGVYAMARFQEVRAALLDHQTFVSGRGVGLADFATEEPWRPPSLLLETDPPVHDRTRALMNQVISPTSLKRLEPAWQSKAEALADQLVEMGEFDVVTDFAEKFPMLVFPDAVGLMDEGRENLLVYARAVFNAFGPRNEIFERGEEEAREAVAWVAMACKREHLKPGGWGMAVYGQADVGACTLAEAERLVRSLLSAGVDTTVNGIATAVYAFSEFPEQWDKLRADPTLARKAVEESLRWDGTVQTFFRTVSQDVDIDGETLPAGSKILLFLAAANRDPRKWDRPERFDIDRMTSGHVGFGAGIHQCLGQMVARLEGRIALTALAGKCAKIRATGPLVRRLNNTLHAIGSLPVAVVGN